MMILIPGENLKYMRKCYYGRSNIFDYAPEVPFPAHLALEWLYMRVYQPIHQLWIIGAVMTVGRESQYIEQLLQLVSL